MRSPVRTSMLAVLTLALCLGPCGALRAASPPGVQWVADTAPDPSVGYPVDSAHRLADGSVLVLESRVLIGVTATHLDASGAVLSARELPLPAIYDGSLRLIVDPSGVVIVGLTASVRPFETWVMKFDGLTGRALWSGPFHYRSDPLASTYFRSIALDAHGDLFVTALNATQTGLPLAALVFKLDGTTGGIAWGPVTYVDPSTPGLTLFQIGADAKGDAVVSGSWGDSTGTLGQIAAFKYDGRTGARLWGPALAPAGSTGPDALYYSALDSDGNLVAAGQRADGTLYRAVVFKFAGADGSILWGPSLPGGTGNGFAPVSFLRVDSRGNIVLGAKQPGGSGTVPTVLKLAGKDGSTAWGPILYPGNTSATSSPIAEIVDPSGNLFVTFSERISPPITRSALTVKVDGGTGAVLWQTALPSATGALLLVSGGNLLFAASTPSPAFFLDNTFTSNIVLYAGATGATIRGPQDLPPGARAARAVKVSVDANGDVVTLGQLYRDGSNWTVLVKYRGTTGAVLWGPVELPSETWGLPVDLKFEANGDPVWIGTTPVTLFAQEHVALSRLSASTGAVVWGPVSFSRGIANVNDAANSLALDGNGDVLALCASSYGAGSLVTLKYDGRSGRVVSGPVLFDLAAYAPVTAVQAGPGFDVTLAGSPSGITAVTRYHGLTGTLAWGPVPLADASRPQAMALDASGNILLAGSGLTKLRGADGSTAWGPVAFFDSTGGTTFAVSVSLAFDPSGNPVVQASTIDNATSTQAAIFAKFGNASGARLWGPVTWSASEGPALGELYSAVDSSGDVVAAANVSNDGYQGLAVRKYSGTNGSPAWGPVTFDGPGSNYLAGLALVGKDPVLAATSLGSMRAVRFGFAFSLETQPWQLPPAVRGREYEFAFRTRNGDRLAFSIESGALPPGLRLDPSSGEISGVAGPAGAYSFRLRVESGAASVERDFTMVVVEGQPRVAR